MTDGRFGVFRARHPVLADATVGAIVALVLSFVPFSSVAGGAVAASRHGGGYPAGLGVGALSGALAAVALAVLFVPALRVAALLDLGVAPSSPAYDLFLWLVAGLFLAYTVGLGAVGGLAGVWTRRHADLDLGLEGVL